MADLQEAANQFLEDLIAQNVAGLMATFTPQGMQKAMALGQGQQTGGTPTHKEARLLPPEGSDHPVDLIVGDGTQEAIIGTVWQLVGDAWKVNDIEVKQAPA